MNSLCFSLSEEFFIFPLLLNDNFVGHSNFGDSFFLTVLWINRPSTFWTVKFLRKKSIDSIVEFPLYLTSHFSLTAFKILSVFDFQQVDYNVFWCRFLFLFFIWWLLGFLDLDVHFLLQMYEVFIHYFME